MRPVPVEFETDERHHREASSLIARRGTTTFAVSVKHTTKLGVAQTQGLRSETRKRFLCETHNPIQAVHLLISAEATLVHSPSRRLGGESSCANIGGYPGHRGKNYYHDRPQTLYLRLKLRLQDRGWIS